MSESSVTLATRIVHKKTKEVLDTVEKTIGFVEGLEREEYEARSLEDVINDFVQAIQEVCENKKVQILDKDKLCDDLAIALALSSRLKGEEGKLSIDVLVVDSPQEKKVEGEKVEQAK